MISVFPDLNQHKNGDVLNELIPSNPFFNVDFLLFYFKFSHYF